MSLRKIQDLRYGENPHQRAALYSVPVVEHGLQVPKSSRARTFIQNLLDADAAWGSVSDLRRVVRAGVTCARHQHTIRAVGWLRFPRSIYQSEGDRSGLGLFGGITPYAYRRPHHASAIAEMFAEVVIAPDFSQEALDVLAAKKGLRLLKMPEVAEQTRLDCKRISGGVLVQDHDVELFDAANVKLVSERQPTPAERRALEFAWVICSTSSQMQSLRK